MEQRIRENNEIRIPSKIIKLNNKYLVTEGGSRDKRKNDSFAANTVNRGFIRKPARRITVHRESVNKPPRASAIYIASRLTYSETVRFIFHISAGTGGGEAGEEDL